jgi:Na+/serine symporter
MEQVLQLVELFGSVIVAGILALAPGIVFWLAVTSIVITAQQLKRAILESEGVGQEEMLLT